MNQKLENLLNLALETPESVREQTENLNVGFDNQTRTWELIVKYHGSLEALTQLGIRVEELIAGYAILTVPQGLVETVAELEQVEYVEKPKRYYYGDVSMAQVRAESCVQPVTVRAPNLTGEGCLLAVLDSGIDYRRQDFRNADGSTRIRYLWDQSLQISGEGGAGRTPEGFAIGVEYTGEEINAALQMSAREGYLLVPSRDVSGHGTAVAGIAAGSGGQEGIAPGAELIVVKLGTPDALGFPRTTEIMRAVTYSVRKALELQMPLAVNLSFGNTYGSHDGSSLVERFLDNAAEIGRTVICVGSGNEGASSGHMSGNVMEQPVAELAVGEYERSLSIQIWKNYSDSYRVSLRSPGGAAAPLPFAQERGKYTIFLEQTQVLVYLGEPTPYSVAQEIYLEMLPAEGNYINSGIWQLQFEVVNQSMEQGFGQYYLYLPVQEARSTRTFFYRPTPEVTLTIPSAAAKVITVGAYDSVFDAYADFSGRGYTAIDRTIGVVTAGLGKPDLTAPGVGILAPDRYGGYTGMTGTSFATPIVTGSAVLLMEWGIVQGRDPFLYGEKVKSWLRKGAESLRGELSYPNDRTGWGKLCLANSFPGAYYL